MDDFDDINPNGFDAVGDNPIGADAIVYVNTAVGVVPQGVVNGNPNLVGWLRFAVGARQPDFNIDGDANANDVLDPLETIENGSGDYNADGAADFFEVTDLFNEVISAE